MNVGITKQEFSERPFEVQLEFHNALVIAVTYSRAIHERQAIPLP